MASAVYTEAQVHNNNNDRRPLSLCVESPPSSSPFPSPSSSFLPPPMPGAHEFAVKPAPPGRNSRKASIVPKEDEPNPTLKAPVPHTNGVTQLAEAMTPTTPTPSAFQRQQQQQQPTTNGHGPGHASLSSLSSPPAPSTPTPTSTPTAPETLNPTAQRKSTSLLPTTPTTPSSPLFHSHVPPSPTTALSPGTGITLDTSSPSLTSTRPAPPSPAVSRRVSAAPSTASARSKSSRSSRPPSAAPSRNNSTRKPHTSANASSSSPTANRLSMQLGMSMTPHHPPSPSPASPHPSFVFIPPAAGETPVSTTPKRPAQIRIRDFAFAGGDERHVGLGAHVPRANRVARLNRALRGAGSGSGVESSEGEETEEEEEEEEDGGGWMGFRRGMERFSMSMGGAGFGGGGGDGSSDSTGNGGGGGFPSRTDLERNFGADDEEEGDEDADEFFDFDPEGEDAADGEEGEEEEPLYPGMYRALYAFEPEGTAEMALVEDQVVRVVGRGGGVGWAVVVDERVGQGEGQGERHALVPESYLEVVRLDWEDEGLVGDA